MDLPLKCEARFGTAGHLPGPGETGAAVLDFIPNKKPVSVAHSSVQTAAATIKEVLLGARGLRLGANAVQDSSGGLVCLSKEFSCLQRPTNVAA